MESLKTRLGSGTMFPVKCSRANNYPPTVLMKLQSTVMTIIKTQVSAVFCQQPSRQKNITELNYQKLSSENVTDL